MNTLLVDIPVPHVHRVRLHRPEVRNALSTQMARELIEVFDQAARAELDVRCVILTGSGDRAFCAGADLKERSTLDDAGWAEQHRIFEDAAARIAGCPAPVIAAVNGAALGGGCEIVLACDLVVAADHASFGQPEVKRGLTPGLGGTQRLPRRIGLARAKELLFTGAPITAAQAVEWGLANLSVRYAQLDEVAVGLASTIALNAPVAVHQIKRSIALGADLPLGEALAIELACYQVALDSEDRREGIRAFVEKRPAQFRNR